MAIIDTTLRRNKAKVTSIDLHETTIRPPTVPATVALHRTPPTTFLRVTCKPTSAVRVVILVSSVLVLAKTTRTQPTIEILAMAKTIPTETALVVATRRTDKKEAILPPLLISEAVNIYF